MARRPRNLQPSGASGAASAVTGAGAQQNAAALIKESIELEDWKKAENERFKEHLKPTNERIDQIEAELLTLLNTLGADNIKTDHGTVYKQTILDVALDVDATTYTDPENGTVYKGQEALLYY